MTDAFTAMQVFALIGLVALISTLVLGELFERAIQRDLEEHDAYRPNEKGTTDGRE